MSVDVIEDLIAVYKGSLPPDLMADPIARDIAEAVATVLAASEEEIARLAAGSQISTAVGAFLDQHAKDRGLRRQFGETDEQLRARLQRPPQAGTPSAIREALQLIVGDVDTFGPVILVELPKESAYFDRLSFFFNRDDRFGAGRGVVIALIPTASDALASCSDALRSKVSAGKLWLVQEYESGYPT